MIIDQSVKIIIDNPALIGYLTPILIGLVVSFVYLVGKYTSKASGIDLNKRQILITGFNKSLDTTLVPLVLIYTFWNYIPNTTFAASVALISHYLLFIPLELALWNIKTKGVRSPLWVPHYPSLKITQNQKLRSKLLSKLKSLGFESTEHLSTILFSTLNLLILSVSIRNLLAGNKYSLIFVLISIYFYYGNFNVIISCSSFGRTTQSLVKLTKYDGEKLTGALVSKNENETKVVEIKPNDANLLFLTAEYMGIRLDEISEKIEDYELFGIVKTLKAEGKLDKKFIRRLISDSEVKARSINSDEVKEVDILTTDRSEKIGFHIERLLTNRLRNLRNYLRKRYSEAYDKLGIEEIEKRIRNRD